MKIAANCAAKASVAVEQLENQLKLGNLETSFQGFYKTKSRPENQKAIMTHLAGLQLATKLSNDSCDVIQPGPVGKLFTPLAILTLSIQGFKFAEEGELSKARKANKTKLSRTRPTPKFDLNDVKKDEAVRKDIIGFFEATLRDQGKGEWCLAAEGRKLALTTLRISKKFSKSPSFSLFF